MTTVACYSWIMASLIYLVLAGLHLIYTFYGKKLYPDSEELIKKMQNSHVNIARNLSMWKAWIGFNASHSAGGIFLACSNLILAIFYFDLLAHSPGLQLLTIATSLFFLFLGFTYWFIIPRTGILISTLLYILAFILFRL